ncbi:response regulator [Spirulina sp. CCNP1310]|uniref:hybrid sensor histidine kinase/response regulator n=1 Tax=Spirulina sp. CCNP1310 TaxID=3110249 RepID=UPI002B1ED08E|nr:response regulator [Spirulina sp. CCNP1310]MEA5419410.1 response regulator [Spirulina sp. CCNP1310]
MAILLIEDSLADARLLQEVLKGSALTKSHLVHVQRLQAAMARLANEDFAVILLDLTLPDSYGLASLDSLTGVAPHLPIVVLTNTNDDELAVRAVRHGAQDYLIKRQINPEILVRALRYAIERKQSAEALRIANETLELRVQQRTAELKAANESLRQEIAWRQQIQDRLALAQQVGKIGTFEWLLPGYRVLWTAELEALYGLAPGSFSDRPFPWLERIYPEDRSKVERAIEEVLTHGQGLNLEFRIIWPDGQLHWIAITSTVFKAEQGQPQRMIGLHMDITEKKQLEAQFLRAQRLESLGTLASGIAHDLNNILTPVLSVAQLLPLKFPDLNEQTRNLLTILETSARRGSDLIKQILSFARGIEGKRVCLQVNHLITEIRHIIRQTLPKSIDIFVEVDPDLWMVHGDVTQLHQVLMNLCVNARDAMPHGGSLSITAANVMVDEVLARHHLEAIAGPHVEITISDTGMGIAPALLPRIFDPFFTTKEIGKGTGLGLSAVLGIVKSHGGFIDVQSQIHGGSQFHIYLPATTVALILPTDEMEHCSGAGELILVVDDEVAIREVIKTMLETYQYRVITASHGLDAIARYAEQKEEVAAVIVDLMMPIMDGGATLPLLQQINPAVKAIAMSGLNASEAAQNAKRQGFAAFLDKPIHTHDLLKTLHSCLLP